MAKKKPTLPLTINPDRIELDDAYLLMAEVWAKRSKANRTQVGALLVKDQRIISDGYNGLASGTVDDVCETLDPKGNLVTKPEVLHAESNCLLKISRMGGLGAEGATLYSYYSPCMSCSLLIDQSKVARVAFREQYRTSEGLDYLKSRGIAVEQVPRGDFKITKARRPKKPVVKRVARKIELDPKMARAHFASESDLHIHPNLSRVRKLFAEMFGLSPEERDSIGIDDSLEKFGLDSLDIVEGVMAVEDEFGTMYSDDDWEKAIPNMSKFTLRNVLPFTEQPPLRRAA